MSLNPCTTAQLLLYTPRQISKISNKGKMLRLKYLSSKLDFIVLVSACACSGLTSAFKRATPLRKYGPRLVGGCNMGRHEAHRTMVAQGFRTEFIGVAMHLNNEPGYNQPGVYLIDDWR